MSFTYSVAKFCESNGTRLIFEADCGADITHSYRAFKQPNGNFSIVNLDVFEACQRMNQATGKVDNFNEDWIKASVVRFNDLVAKKKYFPPVHIEHHGGNGMTPAFAGKIKALRIGTNSEGVATLFADLKDIPPAVFEEIAAGRIPYRSVEINNPDNPEISSLALLTTTVPYFKLPITNVQVDGGTQFSTAENSARVCFSDHCPNPVTGARLSIIGKFRAPYRPFKEPTAAVQKFYGMGYEQYRRPQHAYADYDDDFGGNDGDDDFDDQGGGQEQQLTEDDIAAYLAQAQQGRSADMGVGGGGIGGGNVMDQNQGQGEEFLMGGNNGVGDQLVAQNQQIIGLLQQNLANTKSLLSGNTNLPSPSSPPPVANAEPKQNAQQFSASGSASANAQPAQAQNFAEQIRVMQDNIKALHDELKRDREILGLLFEERERGIMYRELDAKAETHFAQLAAKHAETYGNGTKPFKMMWAGVERNWSKFCEEVTEPILSGQVPREKFGTIDVAQFFAEQYAMNPLLNGQGSAPAKPKGEEPPAITGSATAAKATTGNATTVQLTETIAQFCEKAPMKEFERAKIKACFAADNPNRDNFAGAFVAFSEEWKAMPQPARALHDGKIENYLVTNMLQLERQNPAA